MDYEKIRQLINALEKVSVVRFYLDVLGNEIRLAIFPKEYIFSEEERHQIVAAMTPFVGRMEKKQDIGIDIDFHGRSDDLDIRINRVEACKILGYKIERKTRPKMIDSGETEIIESRKTITSCDLEKGRFAMADVEEPA